jgi:hypothetical protein
MAEAVALEGCEFVVAAARLRMISRASLRRGTERLRRNVV